MNFLHNFFFPTEANRGTPYGLSRRAFLGYLLVAVFLFFSFYFRSLPLASLVEPLLTFPPQEVSALLNQARVEMGLSALQENPVLARAAKKKVNDMFSRQYFSHRTPDQKEPWTFLEEEGYKFSAAGENLAVNFTSARQAHDALMASPSHRANILNPAFREVGIAVREGQFEGYSSIMVAQFFGTPVWSSPLTFSEPIPGTSSPIFGEEGGKVVFQELKVFPFPKSAAGERPVSKQEILPPKTADVRPTPDRSESAKIAGRAILSSQPNDIGLRVPVGIILIMVILPFLFLLFRGGFTAPELTTRTLILILLFGYLAIAPIRASQPEIDFFAASYGVNL